MYFDFSKLSLTRISGYFFVKHSNLKFEPTEMKKPSSHCVQLFLYGLKCTLTTDQPRQQNEHVHLIGYILHILIEGNCKSMMILLKANRSIFLLWLLAVSEAETVQQSVSPKGSTELKIYQKT